MWQLTSILQVEAKYCIAREKEKQVGLDPNTQSRQRYNRRSSRGAQANRRSLITASGDMRTSVESTGGDRRICRSRPQQVSASVNQSDAAAAAGQHCVDPANWTCQRRS